MYNKNPNHQTNNKENEKKAYISGKIGKEAVPSEEVLQKFASAGKVPEGKRL